MEINVGQKFENCVIDRIKIVSGKNSVYNVNIESVLNPALK
jgi:hypothetical protein